MAWQMARRYRHDNTHPSLDEWQIICDECGKIEAGNPDDLGWLIISWGWENEKDYCPECRKKFEGKE